MCDMEINRVKACEAHLFLNMGFHSLSGLRDERWLVAGSSRPSGSDHSTWLPSANVSTSV